MSDPSPEPVEKAARAICICEKHDPDLIVYSTNQPRWLSRRAIAKVALEAVHFAEAERVIDAARHLISSFATWSSAAAAHELVNALRAYDEARGRGKEGDER